MPASSHSSDDAVILLPTRMPRVMAQYLHLVVDLKHPGFVFDTLAELQTTIATGFLALAPYPPNLPWRMPQRAAPATDDSPRAYRQVNFPLPRSLAARVDAVAAQAGVTRTVWLYTATWWYIQEVASPHALGLA